MHINEIRYPGGKALVEIRDVNEHIQKHWASGSFYEAGRIGMLPYIANHYKGADFIDVGASIGNHSLFFATVCQSKRVLAIEPYKPSYEHLKANIRMNKLEGVINPVNAGISDSNRMGNFERYGTSNNVGMVALEREAGGTTPIYRLSDVVGKKPYKVLKIDVEHHNLPVLIGAERILRDWSMDVFIEAESIDQFFEVDKYLKTFGYKWSGKRFNHTATYLFIK